MKNYTGTSYQNYNRVLAFLGLLFTWTAVIYLTVVILFGSLSDQLQAIDNTISISKNLRDTLKGLFIHADDWNWLILIIISSILVIVFNLNDLFIYRFIKKRIDLNSGASLAAQGSRWMVRIACNIVVTCVELIAFAYILNILVGSQSILPIEQIEGKHEVVLLGTSKYLNGTTNINKYYQERINATLELYKAGKIDKIIISGDHKGKEYSEPLDMKRDLITAGVNSNIIELDFSGYRTFDSILKLKTKDGRPFIFVSQQFHLERALYIAKSKGINALGYSAKGSMTIKMIRRELFAKTRVLLDVYIFNTQAYGMAAFPRRSISIFNGSDIILICFVLCVVFVAGRLSQNLLSF